MRKYSTEVWVAVKGYEGYYQVSNRGRVKSLVRKVPWGGKWFYTVRGKLLKRATYNGPYLRVHLNKDGKETLASVHRLVLEAFAGSCPKGMEACHNDGDPQNNRLENLRWDTEKNNQSDRNKHGTSLTGRKFGVGNSWKLDKKVQEMLAAWGTGKYTKSEVARMFGVSYQTIHYHIKKRLKIK
jgi:hypothetical protein